MTTKAQLPVFAEIVRNLRRQKGLTQTQLAQRACLAVQTVRNFEQGHFDNPTWNTVQRLAYALNCRYEQLETIVGHLALLPDHDQKPTELPLTNHQQVDTKGL